MSKKIMALFLSILLVCIFISPNPAVANQEHEVALEEHDIGPMWNYINIFANYFTINDWGKAIVDCSISSFNADELSVEVHLEQFKDGKWTSIKTWSNRGPIPECGLGGNWYVMSGYYYRIYSIGKAYKNGVVVEQTSYVSDSKKY